MLDLIIWTVATLLMCIGLCIGMMLLASIEQEREELQRLADILQEMDDRG